MESRKHNIILRKVKKVYNMSNNIQAVEVKGGFYTVVVIQLDIFESQIIDERHFGTKEEAEQFQIHTILDSNKNVRCIMSYIA
nr:MAG TPA: hypothetical protein [Caudoviricetes sp.]